MDSAPLARTVDLITEEVDGEFIIYDEARHIACRLNATAVLVWRNCDGRNSVTDLLAIVADELGDIADQDMILMALDDLAEHDLIASGYDPRDASAVRLSRRRFFRRAGVVGAAAMAAPVVYGIVVPTAAAAQSGYVFPDYEPYADG